MKKKIALLLAAIMMFAAAIPMNVFAASTATITYVYTNIGENTLVTNNTPDWDLLGNVADYANPSFLRLQIPQDVHEGDIFDVTLTNGEFFITNQAVTDFDDDYDDVDSAWGWANGDETIYTTLAWDTTANPGMPAAALAAGSKYYTATKVYESSGMPADMATTVSNVVGVNYIPFYMQFSSTNAKKAAVRIMDDVAGTAADPAELWIPLVFITTSDDASTTVAISNVNTYGSPITPQSGLVVVDVPGEAKITAGTPVTARESFILPKITVTEKKPGDLTAGKFFLVAPDGYEWPASQSPEIEWENIGLSGIDATCTVLSSTSDTVYVQYKDGRVTSVSPSQVLVVTVKPDTAPTDALSRNNLDAAGKPKYAATFTINKLRLAATDEAQFDKDVVLRVGDLNNSNVYSDKGATTPLIAATISGIAGTYNGIGLAKSDPYYVDVTVAKRLDYGIDFDREKSTVVEMFAGLTDQEANQVHFDELVAVSWWAENITDFTLVDADGNSLANYVKFVEVVLDEKSNIADLTKGANVTVETKTGVLRLTDTTFSIANTPITKDKLGAVTFTPIISVAANYVGPVYLQASGRGIPTNYELKPVQIAEIKAPVELTTKTTYIEVGYQTVPVEDITVKEADTGVFTRGYNVSLRMSVYNEDLADVIFIDAKNVKVTINSGDGLFGVPVINGNYLDIPVTRASSSKPMDFTISGLKLYVNRSVPEGHYDVEVGGDAFVDNFPRWTNVTNTVNAGRFNIFGVAYDKYVEVKTPGENKALSRNVVVKQNSADVIIDKVPATLDAEVYVDVQTSRTMVPLRFISTALGIEDKNIIWDDSQKKVTVITAERTIEFFTGTNKMTINGAVNYMTEAGAEVQSILKEVTPGEWRTYLPLYYIAQAYGVTLAWNPTTKEAYFNPTKEQLEIEGVYISYNAGDIK